MELEQAVVEAIKQKLVDTFKKITITPAIEDREIVIRISIPDEIMQIPKKLSVSNISNHGVDDANDLDTDAQAAARELLGEE